MYEAVHIWGNKLVQITKFTHMVKSFHPNYKIIVGPQSLLNLSLTRFKNN